MNPSDQAQVAPTLAALSLSADELRSLAGHGYLQPTRRGRAGTLRWRLRFRHGGRCRTVSLRDEAQRVLIEEELRALRAPRAQQRQLDRIVRDGRRRLRLVKSQVAPFLSAQGLHFHGDLLRRRRAHGSAASTL